MAANLQPSAILYLFLLVIRSSIAKSSSESSSPQNIETVYPFSVTAPSPPLIPPPNSANDRSVSPSAAPTPPLQPPPALAPPSSSSSKKTVGTAIGVTAATTLVLSGLIFFLLKRYSNKKKKAAADSQGGGRPVVLPPNEFAQFNGNLKAVIVDENGLDVLYWRKLENQDANDSFKKQVVKYEKREEKEEEKRIISRGDGGSRSGLPIQEVPFLKGESSTSQSPDRRQMQDTTRKEPSASPARADLNAVAKRTSPVLPGNGSPLQTSSQTPPPPPATKGQSLAPPPPPPPPIPPKKGPAPPPPPPPKAVGLASSSKPPPAPKGMQPDGEQGTSESGNGPVKFKPLHWDKVNADVNHSMVWNKIEGGSFRVDDDLMEALFGYVATNKKSSNNGKNSSNPKGDTKSQSSPIFILDTRKSQNVAIVLRSLGITREEIVYALRDGHGLDTDTLEKLNRVAPTREEQSEILAFEGDSSRLADAESFLFHLLKAVPSAFMRFNAMLFRSNYDFEIFNFKETLQIIESACKELRTHGIFLKLLEAILKAGNRMNAGTSRGNAQAFNLTALRKLSDVKSTDGKITLLHFVVEEVIRAEGKRCVLNRNHGLNRSSSKNSGAGSQIPDRSVSRDERKKEYIMLGLPIVGGLSAEFSNVKKAATIDYDTLAKTCSRLTARATEVGKLVAECGNDGGGFVQETLTFLGMADEEIKLMKEEQTKVMELVKRTTDYYHAGASKDKDAYPLQLFVIVKDFHGMVDQACVDIARNMQKRRPATASAASSSKSLEIRAAKFPLLPPNFLSDKSSSSDSDDSS